MEKTISLRDVIIRNDSGLLLSNVSFDVAKGEVVYLIGRSGTGKTSLMRTLYGDLPLDAGSGLVCGYALESLTPRQVPRLRRKLGIVFQNFRLLYDRTVYDNLHFVLRATGWRKRQEIEAQILKVLKDVGLSGKAMMMPHNLSVGEQQRVGIARAIINNPEIILADEPTGNLDPVTSSEIMSLLLDINRSNNGTLFISTHDFMMIDKFPARVLCCEEGTVR